MLSGVKFVPRELVAAASEQNPVDASKERKVDTWGEKHGKKKAVSKKSRSSYPSDGIHKDEGYRHRKRTHGKLRKKTRNYSSVSSGESEDHRETKRDRTRKREQYKDISSESDNDSEDSNSQSSDSAGGKKISANLARKEVGLEWMLREPSRSIASVTEPGAGSPTVFEEECSQPNQKELNPYLRDGGDGYPVDVEKGGLQSMGGSSLSRPPVIGDGGVSWRLKALRRAKEQAEREGRRLNEVVEERWGSLGEMTASVSTRRAAHANAHLHAIRDRKRNHLNAHMEEKKEKSDNADTGPVVQENSVSPCMDDQRMRSNSRDDLKDVSGSKFKMKAPRRNDSLSWRGYRHGKSVGMRQADADIVQAATSALNNFANDGSFLKKFKEEHAEFFGIETAEKEMAFVSKGVERHVEAPSCLDDGHEAARQLCKAGEDLNGHRPGRIDCDMSLSGLATQGLSANQLAAKAMQLRMRGKQAEADELLRELKPLKDADASARKGACVDQLQDTGNRLVRKSAQDGGLSLKSIVAEHEHRRQGDDGDAQMAVSILQNKQYTTSTSLDDEYEYGTGLANVDRKKKRPLKNKQGNESGQAIRDHRRIITQQERCQFCFDNPSRPKHLTLSIANSTYLMLPPNELLVQGHCYIMPLQHEGSTRNADENVWEELRNYKKCLLRMFAEQEKDAIFMETAIGLAQQRRHCLIECIPLPRDVAKQAPLFFKKAIDEAEDEWSQHNAKKLIDTSTKGLRGCIPKNFPYFHVEFGLQSGYVHVIDDEKSFKSHFGRDVVIGMLKLPEEGMYRQRRQVSYEHQRKSVMEFQKMWEPFDWTKMLD